MLTKNQIVTLLRFTADLLCSVEPEASSETQPTQIGEPVPTKRLGRPKKDAAAPATQATEVAPAPQEQTAAPVETKADPVPPIKGKTLEELRKLIEPFVKALRVDEVKVILNKYAPKDYGASLENQYPLSALAEHPERHAAFVKGIEALPSADL